MKYTHRKLLISAALATVMWSGAALAQSGFAGNGEILRAVPGGPELSEDDVAIITPQVDIEEIGRNLELDPDKLKKSYGTISRSHSGEEKQAEPSQDVLRSLDGAFSPNAAPALSDSDDRTVFLPDERVQIYDASDYPFRMFGLLQFRKLKGAGYCSATLIGPRTVLTAAHCLYDHAEGWYNDFTFTPGTASRGEAPFGTWGYDEAYIPSGYISYYQGNYSSVIPWDIAVVTLKGSIGDQLGWLGYTHDPGLGIGKFFANIISYHGDKPRHTMWQTSCAVSEEFVYSAYFQHQCDTYSGSSGGAMYKYDAKTKTRTIIGVNVAGNKAANTAVRINQTFFNWVRDLVK